MTTNKRSTDLGVFKTSEIGAAQMGYVFRVLTSLLLAMTPLSGCGGENKAEAAGPDVEVAQVVEKEVPITRTWVSTLTGKVNAQIRAQVAGYFDDSDVPER